MFRGRHILSPVWSPNNQVGLFFSAYSTLEVEEAGGMEIPEPTDGRDGGIKVMF